MEQFGPSFRVDPNTINQVIYQSPPPPPPLASSLQVAAFVDAIASSDLSCYFVGTILCNNIRKRNIKYR